MKICLLGIILASLAVGCAPKEAARPPQIAAAPDAKYPQPVYRFDFVLTTSDSSSTSKMPFTLVLERGQEGEVSVGRNMPLLYDAHENSIPRRDVGTHVKAKLREVGTKDLLLIVQTEVLSSSAEHVAESIGKVEMSGGGLATESHATVLSSVDDGHHRYELTVTPTKLR